MKKAMYYTKQHVMENRIDEISPQYFFSFLVHRNHFIFCTVQFQSLISCPNIIVSTVLQACQSGVASCIFTWSLCQAACFSVYTCVAWTSCGDPVCMINSCTALFNQPILEDCRNISQNRNSACSFVDVICKREKTTFGHHAQFSQGSKSLSPVRSF